MAFKLILGRKLLLAAMMSTCALGSVAQAQWLNGGGDIHNTRSSPDTAINKRNVANLAVKWVFTTGGDVSATPAVEGNRVYDVDFAGNLYSIDAKTGVANWTRKVSDLTGNPGGSFSRTTPTLSGKNIIVADQGDFNPQGVALGFAPDSLFLGGDSTGKTASVMAIDKLTGALNWRTVVDSHQWSMITSSPVVYDGVAYVGVCSFEEADGVFGPFHPQTYRGSVVALNVRTGAVLWKTYTVPNGYTGGAVWGSTPAVDAARGLVYVATGNNYTVPPAVGALIAGDPTHSDQYLDPSDFVDSVVALDLATGAVKFGKRVRGADTWNLITPIDPIVAPDYDFGSGPNLYSLGGSGTVDRIGAGEKSGTYWSLNPSDLSTVWQTQVGPLGGMSGGIQWGSATDGNRIYCGVTNSGDSSSQTYYKSGVWGPGHEGSWAALEASTGNIIWQKADPSGGRCYGMITVCNGVMYTESTSGVFYAFDAATGNTLWSFQSGGASICGPSVVNGTVYWGSGYGRFFGGFGGGNNKLYAFSVPSVP